MLSLQTQGGKCAVIILHAFIFIVYQIVVQQDARQHKEPFSLG